MSNETMSLKGKMDPNDLHIIVSGNECKATCYDRLGKRLWQVPAKGYGVNGPGWSHQGGDTPPGLYKIGEVIQTQPNEDSHVWHAYGKYFCSLNEMEKQESSLGRAGVGVHGAGSGCANPLAPRQGWCATEGCIRLQNEDLENVWVPAVLKAKRSNGTVYVRMVWE